MQVIDKKFLSDKDNVVFIDEYDTINGAKHQKVKWDIDYPKMGLMARVRNLRNFVKHDVNLDYTIKCLTDANVVKKSKMLPFRWYSAYRELGGACLSSNNSWFYNTPTTPEVMGSPQLLAALEDAFDLSVANLPDLGDDVLIVVDQSGSMQSLISNKSTVTCAEIAGVLGAAVWFNQVRRGKKAMVAGFACRGKVYNWSTRTSALAAAKEMMNTNLGGSTQIETAWNAAKRAKLTPSTIVVLSDMQMTGRGGYGRYDSIMTPEKYGLADKDTLKISVNLQGYDNSPLAMNNGWFQLAGWSERVFDLMEAMRNPGDSVKLINGIDV